MSPLSGMGGGALVATTVRMAAFSVSSAATKTPQGEKSDAPCTYRNQLQKQAATKRGPLILARMLRVTRILGGTGFAPSIFVKVLQLPLLFVHVVSKILLHVFWMGGVSP